jgi:hypothetical protein
MITLHNAIRDLNPTVITIRGEVAYDANEQEVTYNREAAEAKLMELQAQEEAAAQAKIDARQAALNKLMALGLTEAEALALGGTV